MTDQATDTTPTSPATPAWQPDILGDGYEQLTLPLGTDDEGDVVATLVRYVPAPGTVPAWDPPRADLGADLLYLHGWSDYFFQTELAEFVHAQGSRFFALDLRKYGRSHRDGQTWGFTDDLRTYFADIEAALGVMGHGMADDEREHADRPLVIMGHSTGGLTASLWAAAFPGRVSAVVLNAPWLEFQVGAAGRRAVQPVISIHSHLDARGRMPTVDLGFYTRSVSSQFEGEWDYDLSWRPEHGFALAPAWVDAVLHAQGDVQRGLGITAPVLVVLSAHSNLAPRWSESMRSSDTALDVRQVAVRSVDLGRMLTLERFDGALHDTLLSRLGVRRQVYASIAQWLGTYVRGTVTAPELLAESARTPAAGT